jgi:uncharacterized protein YeaO (DUF488 family)
VKIKLKRAYEPPKPSDGLRVLVDRLWPRGVSKRSARIDLWLKEIAPSSTLRKRFCHDPSRWSKFRECYSRELDKNRETVNQLVDQTHNRTVTRVYGAKDKEHNNAVALKDYLKSARNRVA